MRTALVLCLPILLASAGCGTRQPAVIGDLSTPDHPAPRIDEHAPPSPDLPRLDSRRDARPPDAKKPDLKLADLKLPATDYGMCAPCQPGEVYYLSPCVTTDKLFTCATACTVGGPNVCPAGFACKQWGATPCCVCSAAVPACVPTAFPSGKIVGPLRINPTSGIAGQKIQITVTGAPFYIGALFYNVKMGTETRMQEGGGGECSIAASFTPPNPGVYAVEVSQYGGGAPWALAGFFTATAGAPVVPTIQPGYHCSMNPAPGDPGCAWALPYKCQCVAGRCACQ